MENRYTYKQRKRLELYFRCLSGSCIFGTLQNYYVTYEFGLVERLVRKSVLRGSLKHCDITNAEDLKRKISWLMADGSYSEYKSKHMRLQALSKTARQRYLEVLKEENNEENYAQWDVVAKCLYQIPSGDVRAYGLAWAIMLTRIGLVKRYLSKEEAWSIKLETAAILQKTYKSWEDFYLAYLCGYYFYANKPGIKQYVDVSGLYTLWANGTLLHRKIHWNQPLQP
ncbi:DUF1266 domain-containing protein [Paenibacillus woosongensis]|uniref:DUF1266 domain-containing protein n=1 Tax=Paenibacillus woosongensis TaxID=307580 RepID=A0A7X2Z059_9BACL|nr:DUF1266 domain-containing protein [Paenibacillus woosongensis]MUG44299.1 DUF1266 domain-containing protein [Paenibacillus woosongensis]